MTTTTIRAAVYGASGYAGQELITLLHQHPAIQATVAISDSQAGETANGLTYIKQDQIDFSQLDLVFLCTPHGKSAPLAQQALAAGLKVVDLSADLRLKDPANFAQWYHEAHPVPDLLPTPYGLPELNRHLLTNTNVIANPGCYATSLLLGLAPLAAANALKPHATIIIDAKSGVSGAGKNPTQTTHFVEVFGDLKPYNIGRSHRHIGEVEQELQLLSPEIGQLIFTPHLLPVDRGILSAIYAPLNAAWDADKIHSLLVEKYGHEPLITVLPKGQTARLRDSVRTNKAVISISPATADTVIIMVSIDNLRKGASSQAIQNANILFNLPETTGLL